jgi:undecaprenyl-diphosphatase
MIENLILGIIQGIFEWLPVSSEGIIVLIKTNFFVNSLENMIKLALFLHLGTLFASIIYFWKEIKELVITLFKYNTAEEETKKCFGLY